MKASDIAVGLVYGNGKGAYREVVSIDAKLGEVRYRILAARQERQYNDARGEMVSVIGLESSCQLDSLAGWAKERFLREEGARLALEGRASRIKLSPGEQSYMRSVLDETGGKIEHGTRVQFESAEKRAVQGLARKRLVASHDEEAEFSELGAAWIRCARREFAPGR